MLYRIKFRILTDEASEKFIFTMKAGQEFPLDKFFRPILTENPKPVFRLIVNGETYVKVPFDGYKLNGSVLTNQFTALRPGDKITTPTHSIEIQECPVPPEKKRVRVLDYRLRVNFTNSQSRWIATAFAFLFLLTHHEWSDIDTNSMTSHSGRGPNSISANATHEVFLSIKINNLRRFKRLLDRNDGYLTMRDEQGKTPLMEAAFLGRTEMIKLIGVKKSSLDLQDQEGNTALMWAIMNNQPGAVGELLNLGADAKILRRDKLDALTIAQKRHQNEIVALLLQRKQ